MELINIREESGAPYFYGGKAWTKGTTEGEWVGVRDYT